MCSYVIKKRSRWYYVKVLTGSIMLVMFTITFFPLLLFTDASFQDILIGTLVAITVGFIIGFLGTLFATKFIFSQLGMIDEKISSENQLDFIKGNVIKIQYELNSEAVVAYDQHLLNPASRLAFLYKILRRLLLFSNILIAMVGIIGYLNLPEFRLLILMSVIISVALLVILYFTLPIRLRHSIQKGIAKTDYSNHPRLGLHEIIIDESGINDKYNGYLNQLKWNQITLAVETEDYFIITARHARPMIIPSQITASVADFDKVIDYLKFKKLFRMLSSVKDKNL
ncbi:hypothetical protein [Dehalococcoides mccartyi]|uniref:hypothetical protein n=1 Tax=Dehalococcoides mccartyi TaxID=61435 RepID=UPI00066281F4|nr:hypothetical protein [Dehalococcoides mccartyi]